MKAIDWFLLAVVAGVVIAALRVATRKKKSGSCCGCCEGCCGCSKK